MNYISLSNLSMIHNSTKWFFACKCHVWDGTLLRCWWHVRACVPSNNRAKVLGTTAPSFRKDGCCSPLHGSSTVRKTRCVHCYCQDYLTHQEQSGDEKNPAVLQTNSNASWSISCLQNLDLFQNCWEESQGKCQWTRLKILRIFQVKIFIKLIHSSCERKKEKTTCFYDTIKKWNLHFKTQFWYITKTISTFLPNTHEQKRNIKKSYTKKIRTMMIVRNLQKFTMFPTYLKQFKVI